MEVGGIYLPPSMSYLEVCEYIPNTKIFQNFPKIVLPDYSTIIYLPPSSTPSYNYPMSNSQIITASSVDLRKLKSDYIDLITNGYSENVALEKLQFNKGLYIKSLVEDRDFVKNLEEARKIRADFWVAKIAQTVDLDYSKDEIGSERLKFDKLQFLAKADNPDKYGNNSKKVDISIDLKQFKLLPPEEAVKALASDPFAIDAEYTEVRIDKNNTSLDIKDDEELL